MPYHFMKQKGCMPYHFIKQKGCCSAFNVDSSLFNAIII